MQDAEQVNINNDAVFRGLSVLRQPPAAWKPSLASCQTSRKTAAEGFRLEGKERVGWRRWGPGQNGGGGWGWGGPNTSLATHRCAATADECSGGNRGRNTHTDKFILSILQKKQFLENMSEELLLETNVRGHVRAQRGGGMRLRHSSADFVERPGAAAVTASHPRELLV